MVSEICGAYPGPRGAQRRRVIRGSGASWPRSGTILSLCEVLRWIWNLRAVSLCSTVLARDTQFPVRSTRD